MCTSGKGNSDRGRRAVMDMVGRNSARIEFSEIDNSLTIGAMSGADTKRLTRLSSCLGKLSSIARKRLNRLRGNHALQTKDVDWRAFSSSMRSMTSSNISIGTTCAFDIL